MNYPCSSSTTLEQENNIIKESIIKESIIEGSVTRNDSTTYKIVKCILCNHQSGSLLMITHRYDCKYPANFCKVCSTRYSEHGTYRHHPCGYKSFRTFGSFIFLN
jgi:hypothetical protein